MVVDVVGPTLTEDDLKRIRHPAAGAVILFARNFENPQQLAALTADIERQREPALPICVDHEGGRVQRFKEGFTAIPPMRMLGKMWDRDRDLGRAAATAIGYVIAAELGAHGVDFSFAPVLDIDHGGSSVIGDRALHSDPRIVAELAEALNDGFNRARMPTVGKHFPGHGFVRGDSHHEVPVDERSFEEMFKADLEPFRRLARTGMGAVMPAHVIYPKVDAQPAGFSRIWLQRILRGQLGFDGVIFSDDLSMEGASTAGGVVERAEAALDAGCDMVLLCNDPASQSRLLDGVARRRIAPALAARLERMRGRAIDEAALAANAEYLEAQEALASLR